MATAPGLVAGRESLRRRSQSAASRRAPPRQAPRPRGSSAVLLPHRYRHHRDHPDRDPTQNTARIQYATAAALPLMTASPHCSPTLRAPPGPAVCGSATPQTLALAGYDLGKPASWAYHPIHWADMNHRSGRGGMACSSVTKQWNSWAITGHPNLWYMLSGYPRSSGQTGWNLYILTVRMIPLYLSQPSSWDGWHRWSSGADPAYCRSPDAHDRARSGDTATPDSFDRSAERSAASAAIANAARGAEDGVLTHQGRSSTGHARAPCGQHPAHHRRTGPEVQPGARPVRPAVVIREEAGQRSSGR